MNGDHPYAELANSGPHGRIVRRYKEGDRIDSNDVRRYIQVTVFEDGHESRVSVAESGWPTLDGED